MTNSFKLKQEILNKIKENDKIIILRHIRPDGDCLGASLGLREILRSTFPSKQIFSVGKTTSAYLDFLGSEDEQLSIDDYKNSLVIVVDTATKDRIDDDYYDYAKETIKIDHHIAVDDYANINYVREDLPATCAVIADFYNTFKSELVLNENASRYLYVGIVTDTGRFRYRGTSKELFSLTSLLLNNNIDIENIYANLYIKSGKELKLTGHIFNKFKTTQNGVSYFIISRKMQRSFKISQEEAAAQVNVLDGIRGNLIWIFFIENEDKTYRVRLRSRFVAIDKIANNYRGGGHKQAAGATVHSKKEINALIKEADSVLGQFKKDNPEVF